MAREVEDRVDAIVAALQADAAAYIESLRVEIDNLIFDLYDISASRDRIRRFHRVVVDPSLAAEAQVTSE